jgi:hypothetical protein
LAYARVSMWRGMAIRLRVGVRDACARVCVRTCSASFLYATRISLRSASCVTPSMARYPLSALFSGSVRQTGAGATTPIGEGGEFDALCIGECMTGRPISEPTSGDSNCGEGDGGDAGDDGGECAVEDTPEQGAVVSLLDERVRSVRASGEAVGFTTESASTRSVRTGRGVSRVERGTVHDITRQQHAPVPAEGGRRLARRRSVGDNGRERPTSDGSARHLRRCSVSIGWCRIARLVFRSSFLCCMRGWLFVRVSCGVALAGGGASALVRSSVVEREAARPAPTHR